jgi:hypothetical protein
MSAFFKVFVFAPALQALSAFFDPSGILGCVTWASPLKVGFWMGKKHFSEEQIAFALRRAESGPPFAIPEVRYRSDCPRPMGEYNGRPEFLLKRHARLRHSHGQRITDA